MAGVEERAGVAEVAEVAEVGEVVRSLAVPPERVAVRLPLVCARGEGVHFDRPANPPGCRLRLR